MSKKTLLFSVVVLSLIMLPAIQAMGQPPPPPPQDIPIDGNLLYLLFAGITFFIVKIKRKK